MNTISDHLVPTEKVNIRRATVDDWERLADFYRKHFPEHVRLRDPEMWRWQFFSKSGKGFSAPFFILEVDDRVEGAIGCIHAAVRVKGRTVPMALPVNFFVNSKYTGLPALRLFRNALREAPIVIGTYVTADAKRLLQKSGFKDLSSSVRHYYFTLRGSAAPTIRSRLITFVRLAWKRILGFYTRNVSGPNEYSFSRSIDQNRAAFFAQGIQAACFVDKSVDFVKWRYEDSPALQTHFAWQSHKGALSGFAALQTTNDKKTMVILDWFTGGGSLSRDIDFLHAIIQYAQQQGADYLVTDALSGRLHRVFSWTGFGRLTSDLGLMVYCQDDDVGNVIFEPSNWHFVVGDSDRF